MSSRKVFLYIYVAVEVVAIAVVGEPHLLWYPAYALLVVYFYAWCARRDREEELL